MKKDKQYYLNLPYEITIRPLSKDDGGGYFAYYNHKGLNGIMGDGATRDEALRDVENAFSCYLDVALKNGDEIVEPNSENEEKTKRINITLPIGLISKIDKVYKNRSAFLTQAAKKELDSLQGV
ncbi:MAG: type II toxin-antitoxin system HicB family antitoxin [Campylobacteraceae bacterium]